MRSGQRNAQSGQILSTRLRTYPRLARYFLPNFIQPDSRTSGHPGEDLARPGLDKFADEEDIKQIVEDQVCMVNRMTGYEEKACQCGEDSERLSNLSYGEPPVASSSGPSFPSEGSPQPLPVPPLAAVVADPEFPVSPLSPGDSDKENSNEGSFESAQQVVTDLVEIQEVDKEEAQALSDEMDAEVRSRLFQRC